MQTWNYPHPSGLERTACKRGCPASFLSPRPSRPRPRNSGATMSAAGKRPSPLRKTTPMTHEGSSEYQAKGSSQKLTQMQAEAEALAEAANQPLADVGDKTWDEL